MRKDSTLTAADLDNIVTENFAPDIKKLAHEIGTNLDNPVALQALGARIVERYGQDGLRKVIEYAKIVYDVGQRHGDNWQPFDPMYRDTAFTRKKTTKAEAIVRHIAALVKLLENEPDTIVGPVLDNLVERIKRRARGAR